MPSQDKLTTAAHDYGIWVSRLSEMKKEAASLAAEIATASAAKRSLESDMDNTRRVMSPLRDELLQLEKDVEDMKKKKDEETKIDRAAFEANQKIIADQTQRLTILEDTLQKRGFSLDDRERSLATGLQQLDMQKRVLEGVALKNSQKEEELSIKERALTEQKHTLEAKHADVSKQITTASEKELSNTTAEARIKEYRIHGEAAAAKAHADLNETKTRHEMLEQTKEQINRMLPVVKEFYDYVKTHGHDPDSITAKFTQMFPLATNAINQGTL